MLLSKNLFALLLFFGFYSASTPFPKSVGSVEMVTGVLLVTLFYKSVVKSLVNADPFLILTFMTVVVGLAMAIISGNSGKDVVRDAFPHLAYFVVFSVFFRVGASSYLLSLDDKALGVIIFALVSWVFIFSVRSLLGFESIEIGKFNMIGNHLTQSPLYFAASLFFFCYFFHELPRINILSLAMLVISCLAIFSYAISVLRGPTAMFFIALFCSFMMPISLKKMLTNLAFLAVSLLAIYFVFYDVFLSATLDAIIHKNETYGVTSKDREFLMAVDFWLKGGGFNHIFGYGFGALWDGPFGQFSFTHNILSYYIVKLGLLGIVFVTSLYFLIFDSAIRIPMIKNAHVRNASLCLLLSILFSANFESSFKAIDFALCIFLLRFLVSSSMQSFGVDR